MLVKKNRKYKIELNRVFAKLIQIIISENDAQKEKDQNDPLADKITDNIIKNLRDLFGDVSEETTKTISKAFF